MKKILLWYLVSILAALTFVQTFIYAKGNPVTRSSIDIAKIHCGKVIYTHLYLPFTGDSKCITNACLSKAAAYISSGLFTEVQTSSSLSTIKISHKTVTTGYNNRIAGIIAPGMLYAHGGCFHSRLQQSTFSAPVWAIGARIYFSQRMICKDPDYRSGIIQTGKA